MAPATEADANVLAALTIAGVRAKASKQRSLSRHSRHSSHARWATLPSHWSADSVATPVDMQRELAPALRRWCQRFVILYGMQPTRETVRAQLDAIIGDVIPDVSAGLQAEAERMNSV